MRGAVSLAAALALPFTTDAGEPFPFRSLIVFLTFCVILATLVLQGLTLPRLILALQLPADVEEEREEIEARLAAADAAVSRLDELEGEDWVNEDTVDRLRRFYAFRRRRFELRLDDGRRRRRHRRALAVAYQRLQRELLNAERAALRDLQRRRVIRDDVMARVQRELDLEDTRLDI